MAKINPFLEKNQDETSRLILGDQRQPDQGQALILRASHEMTVVDVAGIDKLFLTQAWEGLQLKPDQVIAQHVELKKIHTELNSSRQEKQIALRQVDELTFSLSMAQAEKFSNPLVFALGLAFVGMTLLWLYERTKRLSTKGLAEHAPRPVVSVVAPEKTQIVGMSNPAVLPLAEEEHAQNIFVRPLPWWKRWRLSKRNRKVQQQNSVMGGSPRALENTCRGEEVPVTFSIYSAPQQEDSDSNAIESMVGTQFQDPEYAEIEWLSLTRIQANTGEAATAHLLELEMAVLALRALNQETNALHLLRQHIDAVPLTCAWAYLEYLDICSSIQQRENFELMRQRFRNQFNRLAPYWQESSSTARGLDTYLPALAELCAAWPTLQAKKLIEQWFLGTSAQRRLFQLPAYHDLFDLYDLLDYVDQGSIEQDFSPTVSLLDLDYEFATDVTLEPQPAGAMHAIATLKTGDFDVDVNLFAAPIVDTSAEKPTVMPT